MVIKGGRKDKMGIKGGRKDKKVKNSCTKRTKVFEHRKISIYRLCHLSTKESVRDGNWIKSLLC